MNNEYEQGWMKLVDFMFKNPLPKTETRWEDEERGSWDLEEMRKEFKERLYAKPEPPAVPVVFTPRANEAGKGIASKVYGEPAPPLRYEPVTVYCPSCEKEKTVTPATPAWPRCDDCDEPMRRESEMPDNQKV